jgi:hypothetical protein
MKRMAIHAAVENLGEQSPPRARSSAARCVTDDREYAAIPAGPKMRFIGEKPTERSHEQH